jgi:hypothetical protein
MTVRHHLYLYEVVVLVYAFWFSSSYQLIILRPSQSDVTQYTQQNIRVNKRQRQFTMEYIPDGCQQSISLPN